MNENLNPTLTELVLKVIEFIENVDEILSSKLWYETAVCKYSGLFETYDTEVNTKDNHV